MGIFFNFFLNGFEFFSVLAVGGVGGIDEYISNVDITIIKKVGEDII